MKALLVQGCRSQSDLKLQEEGKKETAAESLMLGEAVAEGRIRLLSQYGGEETRGAWLIMWAGCSEADPEEDSRAFSRVLVVTVKVIFFNHSILKVESLDYC